MSHSFQILRVIALVLAVIFGAEQVSVHAAEPLASHTLNLARFNASSDSPLSSELVSAARMALRREPIQNPESVQPLLVYIASAVVFGFTYSNIFGGYFWNNTLGFVALLTWEFMTHEVGFYWRNTSFFRLRQRLRIAYLNYVSDGKVGVPMISFFLNQYLKGQFDANFATANTNLINEEIAIENLLDAAQSIESTQEQNHVSDDEPVILEFNASKSSHGLHDELPSLRDELRSKANDIFGHWNALEDFWKKVPPWQEDIFWAEFASSHRRDWLNTTKKALDKIEAQTLSERFGVYLEFLSNRPQSVHRIVDLGHGRKHHFWMTSRSRSEEQPFIDRFIEGAVRSLYARRLDLPTHVRILPFSPGNPTHVNGSGITVIFWDAYGKSHRFEDVPNGPGMQKEYSDEAGQSLNAPGVPFKVYRENQAARLASFFGSLFKRPQTLVFEDWARKEREIFGQILDLDPSRVRKSYDNSWSRDGKPIDFVIDPEHAVELIYLMRDYERLQRDMVQASRKISRERVRERSQWLDDKERLSNLFTTMDLWEALGVAVGRDAELRRKWERLNTKILENMQQFKDDYRVILQRKLPREYFIRLPHEWIRPLEEKLQRPQAERIEEEGSQNDYELNLMTPGDFYEKVNRLGGIYVDAETKTDSKISAEIALEDVTIVLKADSEAQSGSIQVQYFPEGRREGSRIETLMEMGFEYDPNALFPYTTIFREPGHADRWSGYGWVNVGFDVKTSSLVIVWSDQFQHTFPVYPSHWPSGGSPAGFGWLNLSKSQAEKSYDDLHEIFGERDWKKREEIEFGEGVETASAYGGVSVFMFEGHQVRLNMPPYREDKRRQVLDFIKAVLSEMESGDGLRFITVLGDDEGKYFDVRCMSFLERSIILESVPFDDVKLPGVAQKRREIFIQMLDLNPDVVQGYQLNQMFGEWQWVESEGWQKSIVDSIESFRSAKEDYDLYFFEPTTLTLGESFGADGKIFYRAYLRSEASESATSIFDRKTMTFGPISARLAGEVPRLALLQSDGSVRYAKSIVPPALRRPSALYPDWGRVSQKIHFSAKHAV